MFIKKLNTINFKRLHKFIIFFTLCFGSTAFLFNNCGRSTLTGQTLLATEGSVATPNLSPVPPQVVSNFTPIRILAGQSSDWIDSQGVKWSADYGFTGGRMFNIVINNSTYFKDLDIFATTGGMWIALDEEVVVQVTQGDLKIDFVPGSATNPKIDAIEITSTTQAPTPALP